MSWGTAYTYDGYLIRLGKNELHEKLDELQPGATGLRGTEEGAW